MQQASSEIRVSVVIPTRNRAVMLKEVVESLFEQSLDSSQYEIIVVDNCSADNTSAVMIELSQRSPCQFRFVPLNTNRGPVYARNLGVSLAKGAVIAFTDSDCRAHPEWLSRGLEAFSKSGDVALVSGAVLDKPGQTVRFFTLRNGAMPGENFTYPTCNVFYRKDIFQKLGGFDESVWLFDVWNSPIECADTDFAWKVREAGYQNVYLDDLIIYHEVAEVSLRVWLLYHTRLLVIPELIRRHPALRGRLLLGRLFFSRDNILFYFMLAGLLLGAAVHPALLMLAVPYVLWAATAGTRAISLRRLPRTAARVPFLFARHAVICGSLFYGSLRSRTLVL